MKPSNKINYGTAHKISLERFLQIITTISAKTISTNHIFLIVIVAILALNPIPASGAPFQDDPGFQGQNIHNSNQSTNLLNESFFSSGDFLIKVKSSSKDLIKKTPGPGDTGILSLNKLNKKHGVSKFEQVAKQGPKSGKDILLFNWYKVTLDTPNKKITKQSEE